VRYAHERAEWRRQTIEREAELRQAHKMEAVGRLAGGVAHDFNNVLTAIFGYSDLLRDQLPEGDPRRPDLDEIRRSAERAASLTRQLLAFSRKQVMQPRVLDLNEVVANVEKLLRKLVGDDVLLEIQPDAAVWQVKADPGQIEQVLMNLAANARDAMPEGGRVVIGTANVAMLDDDVQTLPGLRPGQYVDLSVTDSGVGMPEGVRRNIFEPFFTTKEQGKGTGLGLATVYGIVKQTGGGVYVKSEEGVGTRFDIYLPRVPQE
jgi:signal transduction histidine kinase